METKQFHESDIETEYKEFATIVISQLGIVDTTLPAGMGRLKLILDDKNIENRADIQSTNGRYKFRNPEVYRRCYIPHAESPGVYFFFDGKGIAVYVGKSEVPGGLGRRVASHIGPLHGDNFLNLAFQEAEYVIIIPFDKAPCLAPA
jgi:hypothetical protein